MILTRIFRGLMLLLGGTGIGVVIIVAFLGWRLSTGPVSLAFLSPYLENALRSADGSFAIRLEDTILTWARPSQNIEIRLRGAQAVGASGAVVADVPELALSLSGSALLAGKLAPRALSVFGASLVVLRNEDGKFELGLPKGENSSAQVLLPLLGDLLAPPGAARSLSYLTRLNVVDADLVIDDKRTGVVWEAPKTDITFIRSEDGIRGSATLETRLDGRAATLNVDGVYRSGEQKLALNIGFLDIRPRVLASLSPRYAALSALDLPLSGTLTLNMDIAGGLETAAFNLSGGAGRLAVPNMDGLNLDLKSAKVSGSFSQADATVTLDGLELETREGHLLLPGAEPHKFPLRKLKMAGIYFLDFKRLDVSDFSTDLDGPTIDGSVTLQRVGGDLTINLDSVAREVPISQSKRYWPPAIAPIVRPWIVDNVEEGRVIENRLRMEGRWNQTDGLKVEALTGTMRFDGVSINYLTPMPKVRNGTGRAVYDRKTFDITITGAEGPGLKVTSGRMVFTDLDKVDQFTEIDVRVDGPLAAALTLIDHEPLGFARAVGIDPKLTSGESSTQLKLKFLVERIMTPETIKVSAVSRVRKGTLPDIVRGLDLSRGELTLAADNDGMTVQGKVTLGTVNADLVWRQNFQSSVGILTEYQLTGRLDRRQWTEELGLDFLPFTAEFMNGSMETKLIVTRDQQGGGAVTANIGLDNVAMSLPALGWSKEKGVQATAEVEALFANEKFVRIPRFSIAAPRLTVLGAAEFDKAGKPSRISLKDFRVNQTSVTAVALPRERGWDIDMRGRNLDLVTWIKNSDPGDAEPLDGGTPLTISVNLDQVELFAGQSLKNVTGALDFDGTVWQSIKLDAGLGAEGRSLTVTLVPAGATRRLTMSSDDAGATLRVFDINENLVGGSFEFLGVYDDSLPHRPLEGTATIRNFRIIQAPFLTQLLSIASLTGILDALSGDGLAFSNMEVPIQKTNGLITISDARATGVTLGLTASGIIDQDAKTLELEGTLVPAYVLNSALGRLPIIGGIFSGGQEGGGLFAANYRVAGRPDDPKISVNPLSALAPGFLRNLFGIFDERRPAQAQNNDETPENSTN